MRSLLLMLIFTNLSFSQIIFEKGYYIDNQDKKNECLIRNVDWVNNPLHFTYKLDENSEPKVLTIQDVKEFCVLDHFKFIRENVKIDESRNNIDALTKDRNPKMIDKTIFLKVLLEDRYSLYEYVDQFERKYFYKNSINQLEQLIYKIYTNQNSDILENNLYKQQILNEIKCDLLTKRNIERLHYTKEDLLAFFEKASYCSEVARKDEKKNNKQISTTKGLFELKISPEIAYNSLLIEDKIQSIVVDFNNKITYRLGFEAEYMLPFNKNIFSIYLGAGINSKYNNEKVIYKEYYTDFYHTYNWRAQFQSYDTNLGFKYNIFLKNKSKISPFLGVTHNGTFVNDLYSEDTKSHYEILNPLFVVHYGLNYQYKKFSFHIYRRSFKVEKTNFDLKYGCWNVGLGYTIFENKKK